MLQQDLHAVHTPQPQQGEAFALGELSAPDSFFFFFLRAMVRHTGISGELEPRKTL